MADRICDSCGKKKGIKGGKICQGNHFICKDCVYSGIVFVNEKTACPICNKPLR